MPGRFEAATSLNMLETEIEHLNFRRRGASLLSQEFEEYRIQLRSNTEIREATEVRSAELEGSEENEEIEACFYNQSRVLRKLAARADEVKEEMSQETLETTHLKLA